jgi:hypothetical protein
VQTTQDWSASLDDFGRALLEFDDRLDVDVSDAGVFSFELPKDLGPLTPELLGVAKALMAMTAQMERRVRELQSEVEREQMAVTRARSQAVQERPRAHFIDVQG